MIMEVIHQIEQGIIVCPVTGERLRMTEKSDWLVTVSGTRQYPVTPQGVPVLLPSSQRVEVDIRSSERMLREYSPQYLAGRHRWFNRLKAFLTQDYRSPDSRRAFEATFAGLTEADVCLSVGGGPQRPHPLLTNLNIAPFPNVDVVGDAHLLPYAPESIQAIYCDAVLEHLPDPGTAVKEMYRVSKRGRKAYVSTPFLQAYHGYPHHYQNFTLTGHQSLFNRQGFSIEAAGTCVGPTWVVVNMVGTYIRSYFPVPLNYVLGKLWGLFGVLVRPLDVFVNRHEQAYVMASTTYLVARKP
jgi:uncharacterized protein YbaR (Trm112 family)/SAM-dependent methyltransferase